MGMMWEVIDVYFTRPYAERNNYFKSSFALKKVLYGMGVLGTWSIFSENHVG